MFPAGYHVTHTCIVTESERGLVNVGMDVNEDGQRNDSTESGDAKMHELGEPHVQVALLQLGRSWNADWRQILVTCDTLSVAMRAFCGVVEPVVMLAPSLKIDGDGTSNLRAQHFDASM
jgi:hypothetical protein